MKSHRVDIAGITETWLSSSVPDTAINIPGYTTIRNDRTTTIGGGVSIYIREHYSHTIWHKLIDTDFESLWVTIKPRRMPRQTPQITVGIIYMPPGCPARPRMEKEYISHILKCLDTITQHHPLTGIFLMGDFNHMKDSLIKKYPLKQIVKQPTHGKSILDCVYTNISDYYLVPSIHPGLGLCHHSIVCCPPTHVTPNKSFTSISRRINSHSAKSTFVSHLKQVNWSSIYLIVSCEAQWSYFFNIINVLLDEHLPITTVVKYDTDKPWVTEDFKRMIQKRQDAYSKSDSARFNYYRNRVNRACKSLRSKHYNKNISGLQTTNPKMWWKKTQAMIGRSTEKNHLTVLANDVSDGDIYTLAHMINNFFHSVSSSLEPLTQPDNHDDINVPDIYVISTQEIEKALMQTDTSKAPGPDDVPCWILRDLAGLISGPISCIFNSSIRQGYTPLSWKRANVVPIPKSNQPKSIESDLRPISLTSVLSKHLESFIGNWILDSIKDKLDVSQYGGLKGLSTTHALVDMLQHWHNIIHTHNSARILFIDFSKAFDSVNHCTLLNKLRQLEVHPILVRWMHGFLCQREQRVKINNEVSDWLTLKGGVPQGSWLAPLCFVIYISDISIDGSLKVHKYIDDITITETISSSLHTNLQESFDTIQKWSTENSMTVNAKKTKEMLISFKQDKLNTPPLVCGNSTLQVVDSYKILGITVSSNMTWKEHIEYMYARASPRLYYLRQLKRCGIATHDLIQYYRSVIQPVVEYACPVWHTSLTKQDSDTLEHIQKRAMTVIYPDKNYVDALKTGNLDLLSTRREHMCRVFFRGMCHENHKLNYLLPKRRELPYNLRQNQQYQITTPHTERYKNSFIMYSLLHFN